MEAVISFATVEGWRPEAIPNPARWRGNLQHALPAPGDVAKEQHYPALPYPQLPAFMIDLRKLDTPDARALELTILSSTRTSETLKAKRSEFDLGENPVWTIPAAPTKTGKELHLPVPQAALKSSWLWGGTTAMSISLTLNEAARSSIFLTRCLKS